MNIYLSPSTQEKNIGVGNYGTEEQRMNELADHMQVHLKRNGINFFRNKTSFTPNQSAKDSNEKIGKNGLHVALHSNSGGAVGTEIHYFSSSLESKKLADSIYKSMGSVMPNPGRGLKPNTSFAELLQTLSPSVLIEVDFHDNKNSVNFIITHMDEIAESIVKGICGYAKKDYIPVKSENTTIVTKGFYRVVCGSFNDKVNATKKQVDLKSKGFESFIEYKEV